MINTTSNMNYNVLAKCMKGDVKYSDIANSNEPIIYGVIAAAVVDLRDGDKAACLVIEEDDSYDTQYIHLHNRSDIDLVEEIVSIREYDRSIPIYVTIQRGELIKMEATIAPGKAATVYTIND